MNSLAKYGFDPQKGARNLLLNCVGVSKGDHLIVAAEDPSHGFYDFFATECIMSTAQSLGCTVSRLETPLIQGPESLPAAVVRALTEADHVVFQSRAGDQVRFTKLSGKATKTMSYALDIGFLGSAYCTLPQGLMQEILDSFESELNRTSRWRITCPLGTDISGTQNPEELRMGHGEDFTLKLFPIPIFRPVLCDTANGCVALAHWLMSTANHTYEEDLLLIDEPVMATISNGRIVDFEGSDTKVASIRAQYDRVGGMFDADPDVVHSWHTGIHPQAFYPMPAVTNIERWGSVAFAHPNYTHFHTCGSYVPGEIAWSIFDATIELDGQVYWRDGNFVFLQRPEIRRLLEKYGVDEAFYRQRRDIGLS